MSRQRQHATAAAVNYAETTHGDGVNALADGIHCKLSLGSRLQDQTPGLVAILLHWGLIPKHTSATCIMGFKHRIQASNLLEAV